MRLIQETGRQETGAGTGLLVPLNTGILLRRAVEFARERAATVYGLWIIDTRWSDLIGDEWQVRESVRQSFFSYVVSQERAEGERALNRLLREAENAGVDAEVISRAGKPAEVVRELSPDYDLLLLPSAGGREVRRLERAARCQVVRLDKQMAYDR